MIDYRSDTVTKPGQQMLKAMFSAEVGDDVFSEDPTVNKLERVAAEMFGMEDSIFCASGTMANQVAIKCHTRPGDEVICEEMSHVYIYEGAGIAFNSSAQVRPLPGDRGGIKASQVINAINSDDTYKARTKLVSLENTSNRGGGACYELADIQQIKQVCLQNDLAFHLDGARLFNALVYKKESPLEYGKIFDSISVCLSKGLGAPIGSMLCGNKDFIKYARRIRKVLGGGMRQAGYIAAAGLYALENNIERLATDHYRAKEIAGVLIKKEFTGKVLPVETNIIIFEVTGYFSAKSFSAALKDHGILVIPISDSQVRMVLHLDITEEMVSKTIKVIEGL